MRNNARPDTPADMLEKMSHATRFNQWMANTLAPFVSGDVLELGAGIGNLTRLLSPGHHRYIAADIDREYLIRLKCRIQNLPNVTVVASDVSNPSDLAPFHSRMDTVVCLNVLEHIQDDRGALENMYTCLKVGGRALVLVPQSNAAFGTIDTILNHHRRYSRLELQQKMTAAGFHMEKILAFNRATYPAWFFNGRVLRKQRLSIVQLQIFDSLVPFLRHIDRFLPWPPTSLIGVGVRKS